MSSSRGSGPVRASGRPRHPPWSFVQICRRRPRGPSEAVHRRRRCEEPRAPAGRAARGVLAPHAAHPGGRTRIVGRRSPQSPCGRHARVAPTASVTQLRRAAARTRQVAARGVLAPHAAHPGGRTRMVGRRSPQSPCGRHARVAAAAPTRAGFASSNFSTFQLCNPCCALSHVPYACHTPAVWGHAPLTTA